ncbi:MAG: PaaX protein C-domain protein [Acidimicrobiales bacterium]|jgi:phenylacetic acid degradation operon negative regulatory protein|nr:PaaX protein C-domain protein [Acidimicrobiales bacterium]
MSDGDVAIERPLAARSVIASTLLGLDPPSLPGRVLVRSAELFGISEGTARVAMSRMVAAGELEAVDGRYRLAGHLLRRQARQIESRRPRRRAWRGDWHTAVVTSDGGRSAADRADLRDELRRLRLAELREGVWLRPADAELDLAAARRAASDCSWFTSQVADPVALAARLWDLDGWAARTKALLRAMTRSMARLETGDTDELRPAFVLAAAVLRHLQADPLLPVELLPPRWPGDELRDSYASYEAAFQALLREWLRERLRAPS